MNEKEQEAVKKRSDTFLKSVGFDVSRFQSVADKNHVLNMTWIVFDQYGNIQGLKTCGSGLNERYGVKCDFRYESGDDKKDPEIMTNWLRKNKLYAHALCSFSDRSDPLFYSGSFPDMLKALAWEFKDGKLIKTAW